MKLSENFNLAEFASKDGSDFPPKVIENLKILAINLEALRLHFGKPIAVTSGYRSPEHNVKIGGERNSFHVQGMAADIKIAGIAPSLVYNTIEMLIKQGKMMEGGLGLYDTWVHYDFRKKELDGINVNKK